VPPRHSTGRTHVTTRGWVVFGAIAVLIIVVIVLVTRGSPSTPTTSSGTTTPTRSSHSSGTTPTSTSSTAVTQTAGTGTCPTLSQAETALGTSYANLAQTPTEGGGIVCEYTGGAGGNAGVTIFAHQSPTVFAGQVAHAPGAPAMPAISGLGNGAFGSTAGGRSVVNAYSNASRTLVAAQAPGSLAPVEALAKVALADN